MDIISDMQKILIVDDTPLNIKTLAETLKEKYKILIATNAHQALKIINSDNPPDLILLDVMMPEIDGYELCKIIKANIMTNDIPVIFVTAKGDDEDETKGLECGAVDYIAKPFSLPIVQARVKTHIELKANRDILKNISLKDMLTGVYNRRHFSETFELEWRRCQRDNVWLSLIMIDIDCFKNFNDSYGHIKGDECLIAVAENLNGAINRPGDILARYGGEEFVVILPNTDSSGACHVAENMRRRIESLEIPHTRSCVAPVVTISAGTSSVIPSCSCIKDELLELADKCLYRAKESGRNKVYSQISRVEVSLD